MIKKPVSKMPTLHKFYSHQKNFHAGLVDFSRETTKEFEYNSVQLTATLIFHTIIITPLNYYY
jgi:hypothetical protein